MKIIKTDDYKELAKVKTFDGDNYKEIMGYFRSLPEQYYIMEMFELMDNTGIALSFGRDLHIKMSMEDRKKFEEHFNIKTSDHVMVNFAEIIG